MTTPDTIIGKGRDKLGQGIVWLGLAVSTPRTRARLHLALRKGFGMPIPQKLARVADLARKPGE